MADPVTVIEIHVNGRHVATVGEAAVAMANVELDIMDDRRDLFIFCAPPMTYRLMGLDAGDVVEFRLREARPGARFVADDLPDRAPLPLDGPALRFDISVNGSLWCRFGGVDRGSGGVGFHWSQEGGFGDLDVLSCDGDLFRTWIKAKMRIGDDVRIEVVESDGFDPPVRVYTFDEVPDVAREHDPALDPRLGSERP